MTSRLSRSLYHFVAVALFAFVCHVLSHQIEAFEGRVAMTVAMSAAAYHIVRFMRLIWSTADMTTPAVDVQSLEPDPYRERYALGLLAEEAGEVAQMCGKALRFGLDSPNSHKENEKITRDQLAIEIGDFIAAARYAEARGYVDWCRVSDQTAKKYAKLASPNSRDQLGRRLAP